MAEYYFELLAEEIPAWMHDAAQAAIFQQLSAIVTDLGGNAETVRITSTPRRIVALLANVPEREADRDEEVKGPPRKAAFDKDGKATAALSGFLKKNNATDADIMEGGDYVRIRRRVTGRNAEEILQQRVPAIIESVRWPKMMRWGKGESSYIRPVHGVVSMYEGRHLPITVFGVESSDHTVGHRTLAPHRVEVGIYNDYVTKLELSRVVVDAMRRRHVMAERARVLAGQVKGTPAVDASIWAQWQYLTEYPGVLRAEFRSEYLALPEEVLVTVMRVHQKQLPIRDANERLTNSFLAVIDNESDPDGNAAYGNAFVTNARFADAKFFYDVDRKTPLRERRQQLSHLQFHEKLGNYLAKTERIERIVEAICGEAGIDAADAAEAASLSKCDLVTEMVKEFTELQGKVGGIYAREEGLREGVWQAVYDHYLPVNLDDPLPRTLAGCIVSIADRIDTLAGFFSIAAKPTGSKDPFALRRSAQGIVQILLNRDKRQVRIGIDRLLDIAGATGPVKDELIAFFSDRVRTILEASQYNFAYDEIAAAMESGWQTSLTDLVDRVAAVKAIRDEANFLSILDSAKRIANITAGHDSTDVAPSRLENDVERRLNELASEVGEQIREMIGERDYRRALESFAGLAPELVTFFDEVMVNVEDEAVRKNRMSLLRKIGSAVGAIADVTKIVVNRSEYRA
jgi:glycyl-tRNA synthetase beta chain